MAVFDQTVNRVDTVVRAQRKRRLDEFSEILSENFLDDWRR